MPDAHNDNRILEHAISNDVPALPVADLELPKPFADACAQVWKPRQSAHAGIEFVHCALGASATFAGDEDFEALDVSLAAARQYQAARHGLLLEFACFGARQGIIGGEGFEVRHDLIHRDCLAGALVFFDVGEFFFERRL